MTLLIAPQLTQPLGHYGIKHAALFDGLSGYLSRTFGAATDRKKFTVSFARQRSKLSANQQIIRNDTTIAFIMDGYANSDQFRTSLEGGPMYNGVYTSQVLRDVTAFDFMTVAVDTTQATASDRVRIYKNGVQITAFAATNYPALNATPGLNAAELHRIGAQAAAGENYSGILAEFYFVDGLALTPDAFGKVDAITGNWIAKRYAGTYGNNGFHLDFSNAGALGADASGNGNHWTVNGAITQVTSTPTKVHATLNPLNTGAGAVLSGGNLVGTNGNDVLKASTLSMTTGTYKAQVTLNTYSSGNVYFGVIRASDTGKTVRWDYLLGVMQAGGWCDGSGNYTASGGMTISAADVLDLIWNADTGTLKIYKNNTLAFSYTNVSMAGMMCLFASNHSVPSGVQETWVFNGAGWTYAAQDSAVSLCTDNLPAVTIKDWRKMHVQIDSTEAAIDAALASLISTNGWGTDPTVTFRKNFDAVESWSWVFSYNASYEHAIASGDTYQALRAMSGAQRWFGGAFRISATYGTYAAAIAHTNGAGDTPVNHNLNSSRYTVLLFPRAGGAVYWWHPELTAGNLLQMTSTAAQAASTRIKTFGVNSFLIESATPTDTYDVFVLAESDVCSLSKHTGNGSADGPMTTAMVSPVLDLCKIITGSASYTNCYSAAMNPNNEVDDYLILTYDNAGGAGGVLGDWTETGRKIRTTNAALNTSGSVYASVLIGQPTGGSNIRPATAR